MALKRGRLSFRVYAVQDFADFFAEAGGGEGFLDKRQSGLDDPACDNHVFGIAGHVQDFHLGKEPRQTLGQLPPVHTRHDDVRKQQVNGLLSTLHQVDRFVPVAGFQHIVPLFLQNADGDPANNPLIFNDQHRFGAGLDRCVFQKLRVRHAPKKRRDNRAEFVVYVRSYQKNSNRNSDAKR